MMEKDITRFRGCLKKRFEGYVDNKLIDYMIENEIIFKDENIKNYWGAPLINKIQFPLLHDNNLYFPNNDILLDIYDILRVGNNSRIKKKGGLTYMDEMELIDKKVYVEYSREDKLIVLQDYRKKLLENVNYKGYLAYTEYYKTHPYSENLTFYNQLVYNNWKAQIMEIAFTDLYAIKYYLLNDFRIYIFDDVLEKSDNLFSSNCDINIQWRIIDRTKFLVNFIETKIKELKENDNSEFINEPTGQDIGKINKINEIFSLLKKALEEKHDFNLDHHKFNRDESFKSNDPFYRVLYIDTLRELNKLNVISSIEVKLYLNQLVNNKYKNELEQIDSFCRLLKLDDVSYRNYKVNKLADHMAEIFGTETNSKIKDFAPVLVKNKKNWTDRQKTLFKNRFKIIYQIFKDFKTLNKLKT